MKIIVETVMSHEDESAMWQIWRDVFEREMGITLAPSEVSKNALAHLLARGEPGGEPVGTLSVINTSGDQQLHASYGLKFEPGARVARYMHLAVLKPYRGLNIPLMMIMEAHRRIIIPHRFDHTWLLFDAQRAPTSFLCQRLGFTTTADTFISEYGCRCPLVRDERMPHAAKAIARAEQYLKRYENLCSLTEAAHGRAALSA
jgi:hypothetical protein